MVGDTGAAVREMLVVLALAAAGLLLALLAAFAPWYSTPPDGRPGVVVELRSPTEPRLGQDVTVADPG